MSANALEERAPIDRLAGRLSASAATRYPRRSFFGKVGRYAIAAAVGGTASALLWQDSALAAPYRNCPTCFDGRSSCNCKQNSVQCAGSCPSGTCLCGCWLACDGTCGNFASQWCDCCDNTRPSSSGCSAGFPTNCFQKEHTQPAGCGTLHVTVIRCRRLTCTRNGC